MYVGIDLGTSSVKCVLLNDAWQIVATSSQSLSVSRPQASWSEQHPDDWWRAVDAGMLALKTQHPLEFAAIKSIGLSGQMHGVCLLDQQGEVIRPAILWNDTRAFTECDELIDLVPDAIAITGNLMMPGFSAPKLLWLKKHELENFLSIDKILLPKDFIRYRLTGDFATDCSDASGTSWLNVANRDWSTTMLHACDLSLSHMPTLYEGNQITGSLLSSVASAWGLSHDVQVVAGGGDNAASAISVNVTQPGRAFLSLGTSGVYFVADDAYRPNPDNAIHTFCHCLPNLWHEMNVHLSSGSSVQWCAQMLGRDMIDLVHQAQARGIQKTPLFLPYLSGERTPHNSAFARGVFFGLGHDDHGAAMMQAVLEGVAMSFAESQTTLLASGVAIEQIALVGGGARSEYWATLIASCLNRPLQILRGSDVGGALGAARLAYIGLHGLELSDVPEATIDTVIEPDPVWRAYFQERLPLYQQLYRSLESDFYSFYQL